MIVTDEYNDHYYTSSVPRIDPIEKELWIEWLLSKKYESRQGYDTLHRPNGGFCCLGVYCEEKKVPTAVRDGVVWYGLPGRDSKDYIPTDFGIAWADPDNVNCSFGPEFNGLVDAFSVTTQGLEDALGSPYRVGFTVASLNDSRQFTFSQIADIIRYFL